MLLLPAVAAAQNDTQNYTIPVCTSCIDIGILGEVLNITIIKSFAFDWFTFSINCNSLSGERFVSSYYQCILNYPLNITENTVFVPITQELLSETKELTEQSVRQEVTQQITSQIMLAGSILTAAVMSFVSMFYLSRITRWRF